MLADDLIDAMTRMKNDANGTDNYEDEATFCMDWELLMLNLDNLSAALKIALAHRNIQNDYATSVGSYVYERYCSALDDQFLESVEEDEDESEDEDEDMYDDDSEDEDDE